VRDSQIHFVQFWSEPKDPKFMKKAHEPIKWDNLHYVQTYWYAPSSSQCGDNS